MVKYIPSQNRGCYNPLHLGITPSYVLVQGILTLDKIDRFHGETLWNLQQAFIVMYEIHVGLSLVGQRAILGGSSHSLVDDFPGH